MHDDASSSEEPWDDYIAALNTAGVFRGGSAIGAGVSLRKAGAPRAITPIAGFIRIEADDLDHARDFLAGNPTFEAGGTVEVRALPKD